MAAMFGRVATGCIVPCAVALLCVAAALPAAAQVVSSDVQGVTFSAEAHINLPTATMRDCTFSQNVKIRYSAAAANDWLIRFIGSTLAKPLTVAVQDQATDSHLVVDLFNTTVKAITLGSLPQV